MHRNRKKGLDRLIAAFGNSLSGFSIAYKREEAVRQEFLAFLILSAIAIFSGKTAVEIALLFSGLFAVLITEMLNTAIECTIDRISDEYHGLSKASKDVASAAVLLSLAYCLLIWVLVLFF